MVSDVGVIWVGLIGFCGFGFGVEIGLLLVNFLCGGLYVFGGEIV